MTDERRFGPILAVVCLAAAGLVPGAAAQASPATVPATVPVRAPAGDNCAPPAQDVRSIPWAQQVLAPERIWPLASGNNVTVAVLDSGVDAQHRQLTGRVLPGFDAVAGAGPANTDCRGTGTQVAGVINARQISGVGFFGLAPSAMVLPVRVLADSGNPQVDPAVLARGIDWAANNGANIIDVSVACYVDDPAVKAAVANALSKGVAVVAAVGDQYSGNPRNPTPYPAAYEGVIGVGAIDQNMYRWSESQTGPYVDLVAPGVGVATLQRVRGIAPQVKGTGVASGFVAAAAALVDERRGKPASAVLARLLSATAIPLPMGPNSQSYGDGLVNPYGAMNDQVAGGLPEALPALVRSGEDTGRSAQRSRSFALVGMVTALLIMLVVICLAVMLPRGRRRFWRPALAPPPVEPEDPVETRPPLSLFPEER